MEEKNPVVLLTDDIWHIVEHSRQSPVTLCGKPIRDRRAHARLRQVGAENICRDCVKLWGELEGH
ncbi:MAG TPA: hypothetical protein PLD25_27350 [Chloroflexota bacterium]|nr:hypothetical protein [Chloroflexota bacterium]HUM72344.1 hypothetical protein [Chloroflexota bacterium]